MTHCDKSPDGKAGHRLSLILREIGPCCSMRAKAKVACPLDTMNRLLCFSILNVSTRLPRLTTHAACQRLDQAEK